MQAKTDEELYLLLRVHSADYTPETIKVASKEFSRRKLDEPTLNRIVAAAEIALEEKCGTHEGPPPRPMSDAKETAAGSGCWGLLIVLCITGFAIYRGYEWLDSIGWVTHDHDTPVWIHGDWIVGEYRDCDMLTARVGLKPEVQAELPRLFCGDQGPSGSEPEFLDEYHYDDPRSLSATIALLNGGDWREFDNMFHVLPVSYHGRIDRQAVSMDSPPIEWRCQRLSASLECKALN